MIKRKTRINLLDVLVVSVILTIISFFVSRELFWYVGGFTGVLFLMYLVMVWDDIVVWASTIGPKKH